MPIYEFFCTDCNTSFDILCSMKTDIKDIACEKCHGKNIIKKVSGFAMAGSSNTFDLSDGNSEPTSGHSCGSCSSHTCGSCGH